jgi:hypothetical protein
MGREWAGDEIGGKESGRGMSKSDVRSVSTPTSAMMKLY